MSAIYFAIPTHAGQARIANAIALGVPLKITQMAVGDGNGQPVTPNPAQTALVREKRRAPLNNLFQDPLNQSQLVAEQIIPEDVGDWWIREMGLFDDSGTLIAIANCPDTYKPLLSSGAGRTQVIRMVIIVSDTSAVELKIDPSVVLATRAYVDDVMKAHTESSDHPAATTEEQGMVILASKEDMLKPILDENSSVITLGCLSAWSRAQLSRSGFRSLIARMAAGELVKLAVFADSTGDGFGTTGWTANPTSGGNAVGNTNHNLTSPNSWPVKLEALLQDMYQNPYIKVHNAGYSGKAIATGWAFENYDRAITDNPYYGVPDAVLIDFGLNDVREAGSQIDKFKLELIKLLEKIISQGAIPVLLTSDPTIRNLDAPNAINGREVTRQLDEIKRDVATMFNIPFIDKGAELRRWGNNNNDGFRWFLEQSTDTDGDGFFGAGDDVGLHFKDYGQSIKAQIVAKNIFSDVVVFTDKKQRITASDTRSNAFGNFLITLNGYNDSHSIQGFSYKVDYLDPQSAHRPTGPRSPMMTLWVWNESIECNLIYRGLVGEGWGTDSPDKTVDSPKPPAVEITNQTNGNKTTKVPSAVGFRYSGYLKPSDVPYHIGKLPYGLSKIQYLCGDLEHYERGNKSIFFYGFFELTSSSKNVVKNVVVDVLPGEGHLALNLDEDAHSFGLCDNERALVYIDASLPVGCGVVMAHSSSFGGSISGGIDGYGSQQATVLYRHSATTVRIGIVKKTANGEISLLPRTIAYPITFSGDRMRCRVGISRFYAEGDMGSGHQIITLSDEWSGATAQITNIPTSDVPISFAGTIGGTYSNANLVNLGGSIEVNTMFVSVE